MRNRISSQKSLVSNFQMHGIRSSKNNRIAVTGFTIDGQLALPSRSFWRWLFFRYSDSVGASGQESHEGNKIDEAEFFDRLLKLKPNAEVEYEIDWDDEGTAVLRAPSETAEDSLPPTAGSRLPKSLTHGDRSGSGKHAEQLDRYFVDGSPGTPRFSVN